MVDRGVSKFFALLAFQTMSVLATVRARLRDGRLHGQSNLQEVRGIGPYLEARLARAVGTAPPLTLARFWTAFDGNTTERTLKRLYRALQNARCNQCVASRRNGDDDFHAADVNEHGYEAAATLLNWRLEREPGAVARGRLPARLPRRAAASKRCACRAAGDCHGPCVMADGLCVPRAHNARGFLGVPSHPDQSVVARTDAERRSVRRRGQTRLTDALRHDPSSAADMAAGHARSVRYSRRGGRMWRRPSPKVRLPVRV